MPDFTTFWTEPKNIRFELNFLQIFTKIIILEARKIDLTKFVKIIEAIKQFLQNFNSLLLWILELAQVWTRAALVEPLMIRV